MANRVVLGVLRAIPSLANHNAARADAFGPCCDTHLLEIYPELKAASRLARVTFSSYTRSGLRSERGLVFYPSGILPFLIVLLPEVDVVRKYDQLLHPGAN